MGFYFRNFLQANQAFDAAVLKEPSNEDYLFASAFTKHRLENWEGARKHYEDHKKLLLTLAQDDIVKLRISLTDLLITKVKNKMALQGRAPRDRDLREPDEGEIRGARLGEIAGIFSISFLHTISKLLAFLF